MRYRSRVRRPYLRRPYCNCVNRLRGQGFCLSQQQRISSKSQNIGYTRELPVVKSGNNASSCGAEVSVAGRALHSSRWLQRRARRLVQQVVSRYG